ncbi:MAG: glutamate--cysteine ligase [Gammaproteobacteria bacterium]|nr:glutamate--cysteine ligase [Gammaproteobacteria bacterium]
MYRIAEQRLSKLVNQGGGRPLAESRIGLEKESLRVSREGSLAQTSHPAALGSPLTHPYITTDYSEALAEFITPPCTDIPTALNFLRDTQQFVYSVLDATPDRELLWATSMPCVVAGETSIPIAQYGDSNAGIMKTVYRRGLGHRYGRVMQVIAGVHFNYSFSDSFWSLYQDLEQQPGDAQTFISAQYFGLIRNLQRFGWLVPYLFGASPAVCKSFLGSQPTLLDSFDEHTYFQPFATSLRMGDIGYQNNKEAEMGVKANYDSMEAYVASLMKATETPYPEFEKLGVVVDGRYEQLNANILQIENEYYSTIRPKQIVDPFEKPSHALLRRGVQYVELRSVDVNAYDPSGISERQLRFLEAFLVFCLLHESPPIGEQERRDIDYNELSAAHRGRDPHLLLNRNGKKVYLKNWAAEIIEAMTGVCELLDGEHEDKLYSNSLGVQAEKIKDPDRTPSARMLAEMREQGEGFFHFALRMSQQHQACFQRQASDPARKREFVQQAEQSWVRQHELEATREESFTAYLQRYFAQSV